MKILDLTYKKAEENLACDEALLDEVDQGQSGEILRFWSPDKFFVVLGYSRRLSQDVHLESCQKNEIPILRRISGGGTVLQGPGCLNYSLILMINNHANLATIAETNRYIMNKQRLALKAVGLDNEVRGITDLAVNEIKFSGNAQRRKMNAVLFHGTFLLKMDLKKVSLFLKNPPEQPDYRKNRSHENFIKNIDLDEKNIKEALINEWGAKNAAQAPKEEKLQALIKDHYAKDAWNHKY